MHRPVTEHRVFAHLVQWTSLYLINCKKYSLEKNNPHVEVPFIYQIVAKWRFWRVCINWLACCTAKEMSGWIIVKFFKFPMNSWYKDESNRSLPSSSRNLRFTYKGVRTKLPDRRIVSKITFYMYLCWCNNIPVWVVCTSRPRKY